uniref:Transcription factor Sp7 n=1 Tax=Knipowitschia caucasica TaxID=637954 RepID=A0AAV2LP00_KNICA
MAHPYEPWLRTAPSSGNSEDTNMASWWDMHPGGGWLDLQTGQGLPTVSAGGSMGLQSGMQSSLGQYGSDPQLCGLASQHAPPSHTSLVFPQDGFKLEPIGAEMLPQEPYPVQEPQERPVSMRPKPQRRSSSRGGGQAACRCPNCVHAEQLGQSADDRRKHMHNCHIPGCGKAYAKTSHLKAHLRWHSGDRPFVCNWLFCGKRFTRSEELQRHIQTHTGAKKLSCPLCNRVFMRNDHLTKHMRSHAPAVEAAERVNGDKGFDGTAPPQSAPNVSASDVPEPTRKLKTEPDSAVTGQSG